MADIKLSTEQRRRIKVCATRERRETDLVAIEVRFVPTTGSIHPHEIWLKCPTGHWYQRGSYKTDAKAQAEAHTLRTCFKLQQEG